MDGNVVYTGTNASCTLENIRLWWCVGQGDAYLYRWTAKNAEHEVSGRIGFRTVKLVMNGGGADHEPLGFPKSRYPAPITIELNGRRIFAKGSNWVNPDLFFGRITEAQYRELLVAAKEANMNILRLWGGSGLKKKEFYEICDELGIMLWQEFMLACNNYVGTPAYLKILEQEATAVIRELRCHPSIVLWCGGNELFNDWSCMDDQSHALRLLNKLCYEHDFERPFIMTSPLFGMKHGCYVFDDGNQQVYKMFQNGHGTAYSEFGVPSTASVENLKKIIPEDELFPIERTESWVYHHAFGAWGEERWLCLDVVRKYFGEPSCIEDVVNATQWLQCEGYKAIFEEARRQWPYCSMAINWCFNEPWITAANNALFTYPAEKKPAYYAVRDSLRSTVASARLPKFDWRAGEEFSFELWYLNDAPEAVSDTIRASVTIGSRTYDLACWETGNVSANTNKQGETVRMVLPEADTDTNELLLTLESELGNSIVYKLLYRK
ncbi:MAG: glycoside hydrolase family 2 TIM barrel-domain containing protein [Eubacteriales bacterium]